MEPRVTVLKPVPDTLYPIPDTLFGVEARGIEPRSEMRSTTASTCVSHRLRSAATGRRATHGCTSLLEFHPVPEGATPDYPDIAILSTPPRAGFVESKARYSCELRSQGQFRVGSCDFAEFFTSAQQLGTQPRLHRPRRSQVAPVNYAINLSKRAHGVNASGVRMHVKAPM
jgi:hypothetical protein